MPLIREQQSGETLPANCFYRPPMRAAELSVPQGIGHPWMPISNESHTSYALDIISFFPRSPVNGRRS